MIGDLFDSPWKILIVAIVIIVLFGSRKLPDAARSLGRSMRILKSEVQGMHEDEPSAPVQATTVQATPAQIQPAQPAADTQAQIADLQKQVDDQAKIADLQKQLTDLQQQAK
ncbi:MAG TPA: Sec-independent protein translocase subunit TatA [Trebonia sp.]|nr:Sec-independent protein translocase subunit TatA [Trebonia sp.]